MKFGWKCQWCMRCVYECPVNAIHPRLMKSVVLAGGYDLNAILSAPDTGENVDACIEKSRQLREYFDT